LEAALFFGEVLVLFFVGLALFPAEEPAFLLVATFLSVADFAAVEDFFESADETDFDAADFFAGADFLVVVADFEDGVFVFEAAISFSSNVLLANVKLLLFYLMGVKIFFPSADQPCRAIRAVESRSVEVFR